MVIKEQVSKRLDFTFNSKAEELFFDAMLEYGPGLLGDFIITPNAACASVTKDGRVFGKEPDFIIMANGMLVVVQLNGDKYHESFSKDFRSQYAYTANKIPVIPLPVDLMNQYGGQYLVKVLCDAIHQLYQSGVRMMTQRSMADLVDVHNDDDNTDEG